MARLKAGILISGRGSNMAALIAATRIEDFPAEIALVVSNRADAGGLALAREAGVPTAVVPHRDYPDRESFDRAISAELERAEVDLICLAGFMRIFSPWFPARWPNRILNIHPSLLPSFKGLRVQQQAIDANARVSGCTVHIVTNDLDDGPTVAQAAVPVLATDDADSLAARILAAEHELYPLVLRWFAEGRVRLEPREGLPPRVVIQGVPPDAALLWRP